MKKIFYSVSVALLIIISGCKTNNHVMKCPEVFASKGHHAIWAKAPHIGEHNSSKQSAANTTATPVEKNTAIASTSKELTPFELKIPRIATGKLNDDELEGLNKVFVKYSNDKVQIEKRANGRIYLKANSQKDFFKLATNLMAAKKANPAAMSDGDTGGRIALAGGIIGIVELVFALGPFISYGAFLLGIIAIILGAVGLRSSRRGWAIAGIVLGALAILFAGVLGIGLYVVVLHI